MQRLQRDVHSFHSSRSHHSRNISASIKGDREVLYATMKEWYGGDGAGGSAVEDHILFDSQLAVVALIGAAVGVAVVVAVAEYS